VWRVLRPGGRFLIYNLPNRLSWVEAIMQMRGNAHDRRYMMRQARRWLEGSGFDVHPVAYENLLPCSLSSLHPTLRAVLFPVVTFLGAIDPVLSRTPPFRLFATNLTLFAQKRDGA
jgi:hypothetical protein